MTTKQHRKAIPVGVKLHACLLLLGYTEEEIAHGLRWDHFPALGLRVVDPETGVMTPAPNDPRYIRPMRIAEHDRKTFGSRATTAGGDIHAIAKVKRLNGETPKRKKQKIKSRPFRRQNRKLP